MSFWHTGLLKAALVIFVALNELTVHAEHLKSRLFAFKNASVHSSRASALRVISTASPIDMIDTKGSNVGKSASLTRHGSTR